MTRPMGGLSLGAMPALRAALDPAIADFLRHASPRKPFAFPDVDMPGIGARQAARRIEAKNARIRVMMISVNKEEAQARAAPAAGADAVAAQGATEAPAEASR